MGSQRSAVKVCFAIFLAMAIMLAPACSSGSSGSHKSTSSSSSASSSSSLAGSSKSLSKSHSSSSASSPQSSQHSEPQIPVGAINWTEADEYIGRIVTIYGDVKDTKYASTSNGSPTFIDIGAAYPSASRVTMTIWGQYRSAFPSAPESMYRGKTVCVTGEVYLYDGICNIEVTSPSQIEIL